MSNEDDLAVRSDSTQKSESKVSIRLNTDATQQESPPPTEHTVSINGSKRSNSQSSLSSTYSSTLPSDGSAVNVPSGGLVSDASETETISTAKANSIDRRPVAVIFGPLIDPIPKPGTLTVGVESLKAPTTSELFLLNYNLHIRFLLGGSLLSTEKLITLVTKSSTSVVKLRSTRLRHLDEGSQFTTNYEAIATITVDGNHTIGVSVPLLSTVEFSANVLITESWLTQKQIWRRRTEMITLGD